MISGTVIHPCGGGAVEAGIVGGREDCFYALEVRRYYETLLGQRETEIVIRAFLTYELGVLRVKKHPKIY